MRTWWNKKIFIFGLFLALSYIIYLPSLSGSYLQDDDLAILGCQPYYAKGLWASLKYLCQNPNLGLAIANRPVAIATFWLNYKMGGLSLVTYKATNIFLHALLVFLIFILFQYLCKLHAPGHLTLVPLLSALLFLFHPLHFQSIDNIVRRTVILSAILGVLGFYSFLKFQYEKKLSFYILALLCLPLSLFAKETGVAFIVVLLLYIAIFAKPGEKKNLLLSCLPIIILTGGILSYLLIHQLNPQGSNAHPIEYLILESRVVWMYWKLFFWPWPLSLFYLVPADTSPLHIVTWLAFISHLLLIAIAVFMTRTKTYQLCGFCILSAYLLILPESSLFRMYFPIEAYRTYPPFIFLSLALVLFLTTKFKNHRMVTALLLTICLVLGGITYYKNFQITHFTNS